MDKRVSYGILLCCIIIGTVSAVNPFVLNPVSGTTYQNTGNSLLVVYVKTTSTANVALGSNSLNGLDVCNIAGTSSCTVEVPVNWNYTPTFSGGTTFVGQYQDIYNQTNTWGKYQIYNTTDAGGTFIQVNQSNHRIANFTTNENGFSNSIYIQVHNGTSFASGLFVVNTAGEGDALTILDNGTLDGAHNQLDGPNGNAIFASVVQIQGASTLFSGTGNPNNAVVAANGDIYFDQNQSRVWVNLNGNTLWALVGPSNGNGTSASVGPSLNNLKVPEYAPMGILIYAIGFLLFTALIYYSFGRIPKKSNLVYGLLGFALGMLAVIFLAIGLSYTITATQSAYVITTPAGPVAVGHQIISSKPLASIFLLDALGVSLGTISAIIGIWYLLFSTFSMWKKRKQDKFKK